MKERYLIKCKTEIIQYQFYNMNAELILWKNLFKAQDWCFS
jgi:spore coat protein U-like protein